MYSRLIEETRGKAKNPRLLKPNPTALQPGPKSLAPKPQNLHTNLSQTLKILSRQHFTRPQGPYIQKQLEKRHDSWGPKKKQEPTEPGQRGFKHVRSAMKLKPAR